MQASFKNHKKYEDLLVKNSQYKLTFFIVPILLIGCFLLSQWELQGETSANDVPKSDVGEFSRGAEMLVVASGAEVEIGSPPEESGSEPEAILDMPIKKLRETYQSYNYYSKDTLFSLSRNGDIAASRLLATNFFTELSAAEMNELFALGAGSTAALRVADFDPSQPLVRFRDRQKLKLAGLIAASVIGYPHTAVTIDGIKNNLGELSQDEIRNIQEVSEKKIQFVERYRQEKGLQPIVQIPGLTPIKGGVAEAIKSLFGPI